MGFVNDLIRTGGQVVNTITGAATGAVNQVQQAVMRPAVQTVQRVAAPVVAQMNRYVAPAVTQANSYVNQANRYVAPVIQSVQRVIPITQVIANPIGGLASYAGSTAARVVPQYINQVSRYVAPTIQNVQRAAPISLAIANPMAAVGRFVGTNAIRTVTPYIQQASRSIAPTIQNVQRIAPISLAIANPMAAVGRFVGTNAVRTVTPYIQQASRSIAPTIQNVQRIAPISLAIANPMAAVGSVMGRVAANVVTPYIQQAANNFGKVSNSLIRNPVQTIMPAIKTVQRIAPISLAIANPMAAVGRFVGTNAVRTVTPYIQQASRSIAPTIQNVQRAAPIALAIANPMAGVGSVMGRVAANVVTPYIQQAANNFGKVSNSLIRNPVQTIMPAIKTVQRMAPISMAIVSPITGGGAVIGMAAAKAATPLLKQTGALFKTNPSLSQAAGNFTKGLFPIMALASTLGGGDQRMWQTSSINQKGSISKSWGESRNWTVKGGETSWRSEGGLTNKPDDGSTDALGKLGKGDIVGAIGAGGKWLITRGSSPANAPASTLGSGDQKIWKNSSWEASSINPNGATSKSWGFNNNWTVQGNTTSQKPVAESVKDPGDGSTDALGRLGRGDIIGAIGAGGKWLTTNVPPAAEATGNWVINVPQNFINLQAGHLERGEIPMFKQADDFIVTNRNKIISGNAYLTELDRGTPKDSPYTGPFSGAGSLMRDMNADLLTSFRGATVAGVVGGTKFLGDVVGKAFAGDLLGAGGAVAEGGYNAATGMVNWGIQIPGRMVADPKHAVGQILGEYAAGEFLGRGVGKAARGVKAGATPLGEATGLVRAKTFGFEHIPYKSTGAQVMDVFNNEKSYNVARAVSSPSVTLERVPGKILPRRNVLIRDPESVGDVAAGVKGLFVTKGSQFLESYGRYFMGKNPGITGRLFGGHVDVIPEVYNVQISKHLQGKIEEAIKTKGHFQEYYPEVVNLAKEQSRKRNQPVAIPSPKRGIGDFKPESELFLVFGNKASQQVTKSQFAGFSPGTLTRVNKLALGSQELKSTRIGNIAENLKYNWDIGRSGTKFYNKNYLRAMSGDMAVKYNELYGGRLTYPGQYGIHGQDHATAVSNNLIDQWKVSPKLQEAASQNDLRARGTYHDIAKIADPETEPYKHGWATAEAIRTGIFATSELQAMSPIARNALARDIELHTRIDPRPYTYRGMRTALVDRPTISAKALANADRKDLIRVFGTKVNKNQLFTISLGASPSRGGTQTSWPNLGNDAVLFPGRGGGKSQIGALGSGVRTKPQLDTFLGDVRERIQNKGKVGLSGYSERLAQTPLLPGPILDMGINSRAYGGSPVGSKGYGLKSPNSSHSYANAGEIGPKLKKTGSPTYVSNSSKGLYSIINRDSSYSYATTSPGKGTYTPKTETQYGEYNGEYKGGYGNQGGYSYGGQYKGGYGNQGGYSYGGQYKGGYGNQGGYSYGGQYKGGYGNQGGYSYGGQYKTGGGSSYIFGGGGDGYIFGGGGDGSKYGYTDYTNRSWSNSIPPQNPQEEIRTQRHGGMAAYDFLEISGITDPDAIFAAAKKAPKSKKNRFPGLSPKTISIAKATGKGKKIFGMPKIKRKGLF